MAILTFPETSPIADITIRRNASGATRAYLRANANVSGEELCQRLEPIRARRTSENEERHWQFVNTELDGKPVLKCS